MPEIVGGLQRLNGMHGFQLAQIFHLLKHSVGTLNSFHDKIPPSATSATHEMLHVHWNMCSRCAASMSCWQPPEVGNCCHFSSNVDLFTCLLIHFLMVYLTLLPVVQTIKVKKKVKLSIILIKHYVMKTYGRVEV
jgi:hypothetical protein